MKDFFVTDINGEVLYTGTCGDNEVYLQGRENPNFIPHEGKALYGRQYLVNGQLFTKPAKPNVFCKWDSKSKQWVDPRNLQDEKEKALKSKIKLIGYKTDIKDAILEVSVFDQVNLIKDDGTVELLSKKQFTDLVKEIKTNRNLAISSANTLSELDEVLL